jgi:cell division protein FtsZ
MACLGGGLGSSVIGEIARLARENNPTAIVVGLLTMPFKYEGVKAAYCAAVGLIDVSINTDADIVLSQDKVLEILDNKKIDFKYTDEALVKYIPGLLNNLSAITKI